MGTEADWQKITAYLQQCHREPPELRAIREASERHRQQHGPDCAVYPISPNTGRLLQVLMQIAGATRVLEIGCGLGYSAAWMARALPAGGRVETVENVAEHADLAEAHFRTLKIADVVRVHRGDGVEVLRNLSGPYDLIFDDATYGEPPRWLDSIVRLLRPGGAAVFSNAFPVESYILGREDWPAAVREGADRFVRAIFDRRELFAYLQPLTWTIYAVRRGGAV